MIQYHGTPIGGPVHDKPNFLMGKHALVSFEHPMDIDIVMECCSSFILDNGAFSHWKSGKGEIDFDAYIKWVLQYSRHPGFDWCLIQDKIDGSEEENMDLINKRLRYAPNAKGVPVWHLHESLEYLDYLATNFEWVALGSSGHWRTPGTLQWWDRISDAMEVICDKEGRPKCKLHGLRMLDPEIFKHMPLSSADSCNAAINSGAKDRLYRPPTRAQCANVIAARIAVHNSAGLWSIPKQTSLF